VIRLLIAALALAVSLTLLIEPAAAHQLRPAVLGLRESAPGKFIVQASGLETAAEFPAHCKFTLPGLLDCGARGLMGEIRFVAPAGARISVDLTWYSGQRQVRIAAGDPPALRVMGTPEHTGPAQTLELFGVYAALGVEHILLGPDHLAFVLGLLLFVASPRALLTTITAFTLAHSLTLAASTLGLVRLPIEAVELCIALSILLLAVEGCSRQPAWTARAPWFIAFSFGLLHGFGFASALGEVGLPSAHRGLALMAFNVGVELGQVAVVTLVAVGWRLLPRTPALQARVRTLVVLLLGTSATVWSLDRALVWWHALGGSAAAL
jgi:hydrogenase/urease accessory protein HupE